MFFTADRSGNLVALDVATGKTLWHMYPGGTLNTGAETYELDGRQYVVFPVDGVVYGFALPTRKHLAAETHSNRAEARGRRGLNEFQRPDVSA